MSDSLLQAIIGGNPLGLPGLGSNDNGLTILFPLSAGGTVNDLANALSLPVDSILAVNPGLQANSPLSVSQVVGLPDDHVDQIMQSLNLAGGHTYVPTPAPSPSSWSTHSPSEVPPPSGMPSVNSVVQGLNEQVLLPALHSLSVALDIFGQAQQNALYLTQGEADTDSWAVSLTSASQPSNASTTSTPVPSSSQPSTTTSASSAPITEPPTATTLTTPVSNNPADITVAAPNQRQNESTFNFVQAANVVARVSQDRQRNPGSDIPPPPIDGSRFAGQVIGTLPPSSSIEFVPPAGAINPANLSTNSPTSLQLMALLMAQAGGLIATGTSTSPPQVQPFVDPQALAAFAASMRATRVVDLGAGRSMEFSLVNDRLRRIDPIGQEDRAAPHRRSGDGLEEIRVGRPDEDDVEQTDDQREQGRRRRAAIAAMRRRRRPRTRRCRYWRGSRSRLHAKAARHYPQRVDWAEFHRRQPPRYMWNVAGGDG